MTESELQTASHEALTRMDSIFEFWIGGTFAILVAFYFIGNSSTRMLRVIAAFLYAIFSALIATRFFSVSGIYVNFRDELIAIDSVGVIADWSVELNTILWPTLFFVGTASGLYFIFGGHKLLRQHGAGET